MSDPREPPQPPVNGGPPPTTAEHAPRFIREGADCVPRAAPSGQGHEDDQVLAHLSLGASTG